MTVEGGCPGGQLRSMAVWREDWCFQVCVLWLGYKMLLWGSSGRISCCSPCPVKVKHDKSTEEARSGHPLRTSRSSPHLRPPWNSLVLTRSTTLSSYEAILIGPSFELDSMPLPLGTPVDPGRSQQLQTS